MRKPLVLVVEDDELTRELTCRLLEVLGASVIGTPTVEEAADFFRLHPDGLTLAIINVRMRGRIDGRGLAWLIQQMRPALPIIAISGPVDSSRSALPANICLLAKPWRFTEFESAVMPHLNGRKTFGQPGMACLETLRALWKRLGHRVRVRSQGSLSSPDLKLHQG